MPRPQNSMDVVHFVCSQKMSKFGRRQKVPPPGYDYIEPTISALENELRDSKW